MAELPYLTAVPNRMKPIFLLADSQVLFWDNHDGLILNRIQAATDKDPSSIRAAYLGASNGDHPYFYEVFVAAMNEVGIEQVRMIPTDPSLEDLDFVQTADILLLAGGDADRGWQAFRRSGLTELIAERYRAGAVLVGISAGAVQLGLMGWNTDAPDETFDTFRLVPFIVDVHGDPEWRNLRCIVQRLGADFRALGLPSGSGAVFHPDRSLEPVRRPLIELSPLDDSLREALLFPPPSP